MAPGAAAPNGGTGQGAAGTVPVVLAMGGAELDLELSILDPGATVADMVAALAGGPVAPGVGLLAGGRWYAAERPAAEVVLRAGATVALARGPAASPPAAEVAAELRIVGGLAAGTTFTLPPGVATVGRSRSCAVVLDDTTVSGRHARLEVSTGGRCTIADAGSTNGTRVEGAFVTGPRHLGAGELVELGATQVRVGPPERRDSSTTPAGRSDGTVAFNRPPPPGPPAPPAPVRLPAAPEEPAPAMRFGWAALLAPVAMGAAMAVLFSPLMAAFAVFGPVMMLGNWIEDRRRQRRQRRERARELDAGLVTASAGLAAARALEVERRRAVLPDPAEVVRRAQTVSTRLWERRPGGPSFLTASLGVGTVTWEPPVTASAAYTAPSPAVQAALAAAGTLERVPVEVALGPGHVVGVVGPRGTVLALLRSLTCQLAVHHGPADVRLAVLTGTDRARDWDWAKWLPHTVAPTAATGRRWLAAGAGAVGTVLDELAAVGPARAPSPGSGAGPAVVVVLDAEGLAHGPRSAARDLLAARGAVGAIVTAPSPDRLPAACTAVVEAEGACGTARLRRPGVAGPPSELTLGGVTEATARRCARALAGLEDPEVHRPETRLPGDVALLGLLGLATVNARTVADRWRRHAGTSSLAVPIGVTEAGPLVLDLLHDGPHGLVAGTTGSGKSELLRTVVAALAATYDPEHLTFVLIDYKGGSAFAECALLPHTVGMVTDLDQHLGQRALRSLEAELRHRERRLRAAGARDLPEYQQRARAQAAEMAAEMAAEQAAEQPGGRAGGGAAAPGGRGADGPLPRLVVVIDEFATMAAELPQFVDSLVGIAQRGRSLGVHLLLATQRPSGAVNDNVRANTNLRIALRVQDVADSQDVLGVPSAAALDRRNPGRGYVRLGHAEVFAFQAALVSGPAAPSPAAPVTVKPFSFDPAPPPGAAGGGGGTGTPPSPPAGRSATTDLAALAAAAAQAAERAAMAPPRRPWLPPLPAGLVLGDVPAPSPPRTADRAGAGPGRGTAFAVADDPDRQQQPAFGWHPSAGNLLLYGMAGSGTSTALATLALALAAAHPPSRLHLYVLDFGNQALVPLARLPHVGAVVGAGERERQERLLRFLRADLERRRRAAARLPGGAPQHLSSEGDAAVVVLLDNYSGFQAAFEDVGGLAFRDDLVRVMADGPGLGMAVVATADRATAIPTAIGNLAADKLVFRLGDHADVALFGLSPRSTPRLAPGRAVHVGSGLEVQVALPAGCGLAEAVGAAAAGAAAAGAMAAGAADGGIGPQAIGTLPDAVTLAEVAFAASPTDPDWYLPLGVGDADLAPAGLHLGEGDTALVAGPARSGKSTALCHLAGLVASRRPDVAVTAVTLRRSPLSAVNGVARVVTDPSLLVEAVEAVGAATGPQLVLVDDADAVEDQGGALAGLLQQRRPDVRLVAAGRADVLRSTYGHWTAAVRRSRHGIALRPHPELDGELWQTALPRRGPSWFPPGRGYLVTEGRAELVQVAGPGASGAELES